MLQSKDKSLIIVHDSATKQCAEFLQGLVSEASGKGLSVNSIVVDAKQFASYPAEQKHAKQKILYVGDFAESRVASNNIDAWAFDMFGIRYGWHGNKAVIMVDKKNMTDEEFNEMADFSENIIKEHEVNMREKVEKQGMNPLKRFRDLPLLGKVAVGVVALFASKFVLAAAAVGALASLVVTSDNLSPPQKKEHQLKFAVSHFCIAQLSDFMEIADEA